VLVTIACGAPPLAKGPDGVVVGDNGGKSQPIATSLGEQSAEDLIVVPIAADDPVRGNRLAYVTIVIFSDFQCHFCAKFAATLERVQEVGSSSWAANL